MYDYYRRTCKKAAVCPGPGGPGARGVGEGVVLTPTRDILEVYFLLFLQNV